MLGPRDLPLLPVFVAVVRCGSFSAAARQLGIAKSVASQHVKALEERCGVRLLERTTRRMRLTQIGAQVFDAATTVVDSARAIGELIESEREAPTGTLRVTAPYDLGRTVVAPAAAALALRHPAVRVDLVLDDG